jgi:hypothetical protein
MPKKKKSAIDMLRKRGTPRTPKNMEIMLEKQRQADLFAATRVQRPRITFEIPPYIKFPAMNKKAKHTDFNDEVANKVLAGVRMGASDGMAAAMAGISAESMIDWKKNLHGEPWITFRREYEKARVYPKFFFLDAVVVHAYHDPEIALKMLKRLEPETYADVVVVKQEGSVQHTHTHNIGGIMERVVERVALLRGSSAKSIGASSTVPVLPVGKNGRPHDPRPPR